MQDVVVRYRTRLISKLMLVIFVLLLLAPALFAVVAATAAIVKGGEEASIGKVLKILIFVVGLAAIAFSPPSRLTLDRAAGVLRHTTGWSNKLIAEFPLAGLRAVTVEPNAAGSMYRLSLIYLNAAQQPLTERFFYGAAHHQKAGEALNAAIVAYNLRAAA